MKVEVRVRCGSAIHRIALTSRGRVVLLDHPDLGAERALAALAGELPRCLQILEAWRRADCDRLPDALRKARYDRLALAGERKDRRQRHTDPLSCALRDRARRRVRRLAMQALDDCDYRMSRSRWAGGDHIVRVSVSTTQHTRPSIKGFSEKVWSANGKWSGTNSVLEVALSLRWWRVARRGLATALDPDGRRVFVLDVVREDPLIVLAGRQGRGFEVYPCEARVDEGGRLRWL